MKTYLASVADNIIDKVNFSVARKTHIILLFIFVKINNVFVTIFERHWRVFDLQSELQHRVIVFLTYPLPVNNTCRCFLHILSQ